MSKIIKIISWNVNGIRAVQKKGFDDFINQDELIELMKKNNFKNCKYRNLSGGIVAIHSGWKI